MDGKSTNENPRTGNGPREYSQFLVFQDWADTVPVAAVFPFHVPEALAEVQNVRAVCIVLGRRRAPVEAVLTIVVEPLTAANARRRQEDTVTISTHYLVAIVTVLSRPRPGAVIY